MGNYIYGHITPTRTSSNQSVADTKTVVNDIKNNDIKSEAPKSEAPKSEAPESEAPKSEAPESEAKLIHPYLIEYGTSTTKHMIINNNIYTYTKTN